MTYCRFSSDNFKSEIYCYEAEGGIAIHVATKRLVTCIPPLPNLNETSLTDFCKAREIQKSILHNAEYEKIDLEYNGESFYNLDKQDALDWLEYLRTLGYHVPNFAIECLKEEINGTN